MKLGEVCEHGQLKRQCPLCERDDEIKRLREALEEAKVENEEAWAAWEEAQITLDTMKLVKACEEDKMIPEIQSIQISRGSPFSEYRKGTTLVNGSSLPYWWACPEHRISDKACFMCHAIRQARERFQHKENMSHSSAGSNPEGGAMKDGYPICPLCGKPRATAEDLEAYAARKECVAAGDCECHLCAKVCWMGYAPVKRKSKEEQC